MYIKKDNELTETVSKQQVEYYWYAQYRQQKLNYMHPTLLQIVHPL